MNNNTVALLNICSLVFIGCLSRQRPEEILFKVTDQFNLIKKGNGKKIVQTAAVWWWDKLQCLHQASWQTNPNFHIFIHHFIIWFLIWLFPFSDSYIYLFIYLSSRSLLVMLSWHCCPTHFTAVLTLCLFDNKSERRSWLVRTLPQTVIKRCSVIKKKKFWSDLFTAPPQPAHTHTPPPTHKYTHKQ